MVGAGDAEDDARDGMRSEAEAGRRRRLGARGQSVDPVAGDGSSSRERDDERACMCATRVHRGNAGCVGGRAAWSGGRARTAMKRKPNHHSGIVT
jgi:hypothetical protein